MRVVLLACLWTAAFGADGNLLRRSGKYEVLLRMPAEGAFASDETEIELRIRDTSQDPPAPLVRAQVEVEITMPAMAGMPTYRETAHTEGVPGDYGVHPTFAHGGEYRLRLMAKPPRESAFDVEFVLEVRDAELRDRVGRRQARYSVDVSSSPKRPKAGEVTEIRFVFRDRENPKAILSSFELAHEAPFHLVIVRTDLSQFAHEHPMQDKDGAFRLRYRFSEAGEYHFFADVAPKNAGSQVMMAKLVVSGAAAKAYDVQSAARRRFWNAGSVSVELAYRDDSFPVKKTVAVPVMVKDAKSGEQLPLSPYLGAAGHFLFIHEDSATFVHSHPSGSGEPGRGPLEFLVRFPKPGLYRGWLQVKPGGELVTADFVVRAGATP